MKKTYFLISALIGAMTYAQVGINTDTPHSSAVLDVVAKDGNRGLLLPRLNTAAINQLSSTAAEGLVVYDTNRKNFYGWNGTQWIPLGIINDAPTATDVTFTGNLGISSVLTGVYTYTDTESDAEGVSTFSWKRADDATGTNVVAIAGANSTQYTLTDADADKYIQFCVSPVAVTGTTSGAESCSIFNGPVTSTQLGIIASDNFDNSFLSLAEGGFGFARSGTGITFVNSNGNTPNSPRWVSPDWGLQRSASSNTGIITSGTLDASAYSNNLELSFRLASFSGNANNGAETTDYVAVEIDNGTGFTEQIRIEGATSNRTWDFNATGIATTIFGNPSIHESSSGDAGLTYVSITNIPNTIVGLRIVMRNNDNNEQWVIDDVVLEAK